MKPYIYLLVNFLTVVVCFVFSFDRRILFHTHFSAFIKAASVVAAPFILWDVWFTKRGVWWFNTDYTLGWHLLGLPVEEWLFFFCIPFACVFTYYCITRFFNLSWTRGLNNIIVFVTLIVCAVTALLYGFKVYTLVTCLATITVLVYLHFIAKVQWIGEASLVFMMLMPGFFLVNGVLTGSGLDAPIVNYNPEAFLNLRILTIPLEDAVYGYTQFLMNIFLFKKFQKKSDYEE